MTLQKYIIDKTMDFYKGYKILNKIKLNTYICPSESAN